MTRGGGRLSAGARRPGSQRGGAKLWQDLLLATFPAGAAYYTNVPYIEEVARIRALLAELKHERWARLVGEGVLAAAIGELTATFEPHAAAVTRFVDHDRVSWDEVKALDLANHRRLCLFIARIHAAHANDEATRATLLAPFARQDQEIYELQRDRRRVTDVDPQSGTPIDEAPPADRAAPPPNPAASPA